jgi:hypothetical protein
MLYARGVWRNQKGVIRSRKSKKGNQLTSQQGQLTSQQRLRNMKPTKNWNQLLQIDKQFLIH